MDLALESTPKSQAKFHSKFLLTCSIVNILIFPLCVGLEVIRYQLELHSFSRKVLYLKLDYKLVIFKNFKVGNPLIGQGVWGSITFIVTGLLGFSTSYKPKNSL